MSAKRERAVVSELDGDSELIRADALKQAGRLRSSRGKLGRLRSSRWLHFRLPSANRKWHNTFAMILTETEARVVGALIEKQLTTPEYYPLTLNALVAACNQKTNREPVVNFDESTVQKALDSLRDKNIVYVFYGSTSRVPKYKHILPDVLELEPSETAALCVLMLRGPQTIGEIRGRSGRLYDFRDLNDVNETLEALSKRDEPLVVKLPRVPGQSESRFAHLLCGEVTSYEPPAATTRSAGNDERFEKLEQELDSLRTELADFKAVFEEFKKQFE